MIYSAYRYFTQNIAPSNLLTFKAKEQSKEPDQNQKILALTGLGEQTRVEMTAEISTSKSCAVY
jgi:hypothetical protein